ncbi:TPA: hypothetical protein DCZ15_02290 [Candidatus Falkowbacteria bacterium]|nr:hypothetical protein [Candidatus Falkowbacteria bacterium]
MKALLKKNNQPGSALLLTMFIMAGMLVSALGGAYVALISIKSGGVQAQSTKAYFAAEAGAERLLWEMRQNSYVYTTPDEEVPIFEDEGIFSSAAAYDVYFIDWPPLTFKAVGSFQNTQRSVEIRM